MFMSILPAKTAEFRRNNSFSLRYFGRVRSFLALASVAFLAFLSPLKGASNLIMAAVTDENEAPTVSSTTFMVAENTANGTSVGTVAGAGTGTSFAITGGNFLNIKTRTRIHGTGSPFAIHSTTGAITVAGALDFETTTSYSLEVTVTDGGGLSSKLTITITVTDENEAPTASDAPFSVAENSAMGTVVGTATATDPDLASLSNGTLTYAFTKARFQKSGKRTIAFFSGGPFAINSTTGEITVTGALDFETTAEYTLDLKVTDGGGLSSTATITITVTNENEEPTASDAPFSVAENSATDGTTVVGTVVGTDPDQTSPNNTLTYAITSGNTEDVFAINSTTGAITVAGALDFESTPRSYSLVVTVTDGGSTPLSGTATITITVTDENEAPTASNDAFSLAENSAIGTTVVGTVRATDPDLPSLSNGKLTYAFTGAAFRNLKLGRTINTLFSGGPFAINSTTGELTVNGVLDFETTTEYELGVHVTDGGGGSSTAMITIMVTDVNEAPTVRSATFMVAENSATETTVGTLIATDPDDPSLSNGTLTYAITRGNTGDVFAINSTTGEVTVAGALDFETTTAPYSLVVTVADGGSPSQSRTARLIITVMDENEEPTASTASGTPFMVAENSATGTTVVGTVVGTDPDQTSPNNVLTYAITSGNTGGEFAINSTTGEVTVAGALDFETSAEYTLVVTVADGGSPSQSGTVMLTIMVTDVNEKPTARGDTFSVAETTATGTAVGTVVGTDPDASPNNVSSYAITSGNTGNEFAIDATTGAITVLGALNYETTDEYTFEVTVTDGGSLRDTGTITITVTDVNEAPTASDAPFSVAENSANGTVVGSVIATDPDLSTLSNGTLTYTITGNAFAINPTTGAVTVASALDFETTESYSLVVTVTDGGSPSLSSTAMLTITVMGVSDSEPIFTSPASVNVLEGTTTVTKVMAVDGDVGGQDVITFLPRLTGADADLFSITLGDTLRFKAVPDHEMPGSMARSNTYTVTITASDGQSTPLTTTQTFTITVTDANDNAPVFTSATTARYAENATTTVTTVTATDADADGGQTVSFTLTGGVDDSKFSITPEGELTFKTVPDYESPTDTGEDNDYVVTVTASDGQTPPMTVTQTLTITVTDENDNAPVFTSATTARYAENATTAVTTITATDADADGRQTVTFLTSLMGEDASKFSITQAGVLTFSTAPDYEVPGDIGGDNVYEVIVTASDGQTPPMTAMQTLAITVTGENDNAPVFTSEATATYAENATTAVTTVDATDADAGQTVSYTLTAGADMGLFSITQAGELTFDPAPDFEIPTDAGGNNEYEVTITATDNGMPAMATTQALTITVTGENDNAPVFAEGTTASVSYAENDTTTVTTVDATDADAGPTQTLMFTLSGGADASKFSITPAGVLTFTTAPDFEMPTDEGANNMYVVIVTVTDDGTPAMTAMQTLTITVTDENDAPTASDTTFVVAENSAPGIVVGSVVGTDPDQPSPNNTLTYAITDGNTGDVFAINETSGEITVSGALDYETIASYSLEVTVTDGGSLSDMGRIAITVTDENDAPTASGAPFMVAENSAPGTEVGIVTATDPDLASLRNGTLIYAVTSGDIGSAFAINFSTGAITVAGVLDYETTESYSFEVTVVDGGGLSSTAPITITVTDVDDNAPVFTSNANVTVLEDTTAVTTVTARDANMGQTLITFLTMLSGADAGLFSITPTGALTFKTAPDYENPGSASGSNIYTVTVTATDGQPTPLTTMQTFTITVTDVNDNAPIFSSSATADVAEGTTAVITVTATDADEDAGQAVGYTLTGGADMHLFSLSSPGELTFNTAPDYETPPATGGDNDYVVIVTASDDGTPQ